MGWAALWFARPGTPLLTPSRAPSPASTGDTYGKAPIDLGGIYGCSPEVPYAAYAEGRLYYPPNHPSHPGLTVRPARCFRTGLDAQLDAYVEAAPPPQDGEVAETFLEPATAAVGRQCRSAADRLAFPVPCPTMLPAYLPGIPRSITVGANDGMFILSMDHFALPPRDPQVHDPAHGGHLLLVAYRTRDAARVKTPYSAYFCPPYGRESLEPVGTALVRDIPAFLEACGSKPRPGDYFLLDGHVILRWAIGGVSYEISLHGQTRDHEAVLEVLAEHLRYVPPS